MCEWIYRYPCAAILCLGFISHVLGDRLQDYLSPHRPHLLTESHQSRQGAKEAKQFVYSQCGQGRSVAHRGVLRKRRSWIYRRFSNNYMIMSIFVIRSIWEVKRSPPTLINCTPYSGFPLHQLIPPVWCGEGEEKHNCTDRTIQISSFEQRYKWYNCWTALFRANTVRVPLIKLFKSLNSLK